MGMAASQARLLSITARMSDNEQSGQQLSYAKERLADRTDQVTKEYNEALKATKLQVMTGYSDGAASYTDISFKALVSPQVVSSLGRQYCVTDKNGRVLVEPDVAKAFINAKGSLNAFLGALTGTQGGPFSVSDIDPAKKANTNPDPDVVEKIHEAWDKYFHSVGIDKFGSNGDEDHRWQFAFLETGDKIGQGYATISVNGEAAEVLNFSGTNQEQLEYYNYAMSLTESYYSVGDGKGDAHDFTNINTQYDKGNSSMMNYYTNLYNKMLTSGFYSYTNTYADTQDAENGEHWVYNTDLYKGINLTTDKELRSGATDGTPLTDSNTFEQFLRSGELLLETYSKSEGKFVSTSISEDTCVQEVEDETKIAIAQADYENDLAQIQRLDSRYDLQMKQLDTEHNTLQTEYESVKNVISKNVENSFKTFG
ncbi:MAG: hypothetical protein NC390_08040 [Fusobacterium sp.]|nr:hypothetical protein [Fusobacterium sp.]